MNRRGFFRALAGMAAIPLAPTILAAIPAAPTAAISVQFDRLPINPYIRGPQCRLEFYSYETVGCAIGNVAASRAEFQ